MSAAAPITRDDLESKFREIQGEVDEAGETARNYALIAGVVVVAAVAAAAFYFGRRRGKLQKTVVEIRRV
ncbi:MAG: hypothetical protein KDB10_11925 [Acidimicrobiales bacterium]|nr:hypothetical protein [Acidimicrobiales bacterium]